MEIGSKNERKKELAKTATPFLYPTNKTGLKIFPRKVSRVTQLFLNPQQLVIFSHSV